MLGKALCVVHGTRWCVQVAVRRLYVATFTAINTSEPGTAFLSDICGTHLTQLQRITGNYQLRDLMWCDTMHVRQNLLSLQSQVFFA